eukprot:993983-Pyramimonas_sp.AAC.1
MGLLFHKRAPLWLVKGGKRSHGVQPGECVDAFVPWVRNVTMDVLGGKRTYTCTYTYCVKLSK